MSSKVKNILILGGVGVALVLVYFLFIKGDGEKPSLISSSGLPVTTNQPATDTTASQDIGKDFISVLLNVKNIKINNEIFSDPAFMNLHDSSIQIINNGTNQGRPNPFAPIGTDVTNSPNDVISYPNTTDTTAITAEAGTGNDITITNPDNTTPKNNPVTPTKGKATN